MINFFTLFTLPIISQVKKGKTKKTGTKVTFKPDPEIFKSATSFNFDVLSERLQESAFLLKNLKIILTDNRQGKELVPVFFVLPFLTSPLAGLPPSLKSC